jgi:hypothetical protein
MAVMAVVPWPTPVASPLVVMVPTPTLLELQVTWLVTSNWRPVTPEVAMAMN